MNEYQLYNGDCLEVMKDIPDKSVDMVLCDLPFGTTRNKWDTIIPFVPLWEEYNRVIKDNGAIVLFGSGLFSAELMMSNRKMWRYNLIWEKTQPTGFLNANRMPLRNHEDILVFYKQLPTYNPQKTQGHKRKVSSAKHKEHCRKTGNYGEHNLMSYDSTERFPCSVIEVAKDVQKSALHPTQKPVALLEYLIKTYTNEGETVLDNCAGSMSTVIASLNSKRNCIAIEKDKNYFQIGCERVEQHILKISISLSVNKDEGGVIWRNL